MDKTQIRNAATIILVRRDGPEPALLMGQRGAGAAFMPSKFVFPGGAVDVQDAQIPLGSPLPEQSHQLLAQQSALTPDTLAIAAIRELWEETGQMLGHAAPWQDAPEGWHSFAETGHVPAADGLTFVFRAVTPKGRPRRFDARFFLAEAAQLVTDPDDFSRAEDELSHLHWVPVPEVRSLDLPFITQVVLAEVMPLVQDPQARPDSVPFFQNDTEIHKFDRLTLG